MKSPFPGMDPFIEGCGLWEDFHPHLIEGIYQFLADNLSERYIVRTGERNYVVLGTEETMKRHSFIPDVTVRAESSLEPDPEPSVAIAESDADELTMLAMVEEEFRETFVEIYEDDEENRLVTSIELLSPSNKKANSAGWDEYLRKRQGLLQGRLANIVEVDLLRGGKRMPMADAWPNCIHLRKPLPSLRVPLLKPDPDVMIDLQPMIAKIYTRSRYERDIDYTEPIKPALSDEETAWLQERLRERGS